MPKARVRRRAQRALLTVLALALGVTAWPDVSGKPVVPLAFASGRAHVTLYMTPWCRACQKLMRGLDRARVPYRAVDIEKEPKRYEPIRAQLGKITIPVTVVRRGGDERLIVGANSRQVIDAYEELSE